MFHFEKSFAIFNNFFNPYKNLKQAKSETPHQFFKILIFRSAMESEILII